MITKTQVALNTPFDNTLNIFTSKNVQNAIEESFSTAINRARFSINASYDANANAGRWLEWSKSVDSLSIPFVFPRKSLLAELSLTNQNTSTATITIFKNSIAATTIQLSAQTSNTRSLVNVTFEQGDEMSVQVTAGTMTRPSLFIFLEIIE